MQRALRTGRPRRAPVPRQRRHPRSCSSPCPGRAATCRRPSAQLAVGICRNRDTAAVGVTARAAAAAAAPWPLGRWLPAQRRGIWHACHARSGACAGARSDGMSDSAGAGMRRSQLKRKMCALPAVNPEAQPNFSAAYARHAAAGKASAAAAAGRTLVSGAVHMNISQEAMTS